jgi:hypothetical protein
MSAPQHAFYASLSEPCPVSVNNLYTTFRGKRVLTKAGRAFRDALVSEVSAAVTPLRWGDAVAAVYERRAHVRFGITLHLPIFNKSWKPGGKTKSGELQSPFKRQDATSYIKLTEDAVVLGTGIDDCCYLSVHVEKFDSTIPFIEVAFEVIEDR